MIGNPGTGKSTLLNGLLGQVKFKSGVGFGNGLTFQLQIEKMASGAKLMDTPGLSDLKMREQAAAAVNEALKQSGNYKIFFVNTVEAGRVRPADVLTMKIVLEAAPITNYGVIFNKVNPKWVGQLDRVSGEHTNRDVFLACLFESLPRSTDHIFFNLCLDCPVLSCTSGLLCHSSLLTMFHNMCYEVTRQWYR